LAQDSVIRTKNFSSRSAPAPRVTRSHTQQVQPSPARIFTKYNLVRAIRGFQPITVRITFRIIDEARLPTSYLYEAGLAQSRWSFEKCF